MFGATFLAAGRLLAADKVAANERLRVAVIGCGVRGRTHGPVFASHPQCEVVSVCDADISRAEAVAAQVAGRQGKRPAAVQDLRRIMDDRSIDVVTVATCNHWHVLAAIWALQAGKDVYVEKPLSWCIDEGRRVIEVSRKYDRICQVGTQYRSDPSMLAAKAAIDRGDIGRVQLARSITYKQRNSIGGPVQAIVPKSVDLDLWHGPAPADPITRPQFHYDWHWFWATGNGDNGNSDVHRADLCCWAVGRTKLAPASMSFGGRLGYRDAAETPNTQIAIHDLEGVTLVQEIRGLSSEKFPLPGTAMIYGTEGIVALSPVASVQLDLDGNVVHRFPSEGKSFGDLSVIHMDNFVQAVLSRKRTDQNAEVAQGHVSASMCHAANNSYRLGRPASPAQIMAEVEKRKIADGAAEVVDRTIAHLKKNGVAIGDDTLTLGQWLEFDPDRERYIDNPEADKLKTRVYRKPFVVPDKV